ncbi:hypothetical protein ACYZT7_10250 [Pseudomonas sp. RT4P38]
MSYESLDGRTKWTAGTWNEGIPVGKRTSRKGLNIDLENGRHPNTYRTTIITTHQLHKLSDSIKNHDAWSLQENCSYFASTVWNEVTGEHLENWSENQNRELKNLILGEAFGSRRIPLPSPAGLFDSIFMKNGHYFSNDGDKIRHHYEDTNSANTLLPKIVELHPVEN